MDTIDFLVLRFRNIHGDLSECKPQDLTPLGRGGISRYQLAANLVVVQLLWDQENWLDARMQMKGTTTNIPSSSYAIPFSSVRRTSLKQELKWR